MILDSLQNSERYFALHPYFERAFAYMSENAANLTPGKHEVDGQEMFVIVSENELKPQSEIKLESHRKYIDIQFVLEGVESYSWAYTNACAQPVTEFDTEKDIVFYDDKPSTIVTATQGQFVIFYPEDAHGPLIGKGNVRKAIFKVKCM